MSLNNNKQFLLNQLVWLGISFGISLTISFLLPFPISLGVIFGVFILLNMYMRRVTLKRVNSAGGSMSSMLNISNGSSLKYYCMICGTPHKEVACPKCGSKITRVGF
jgi:predicted nucleic-acid-binding Zn-ribbon protein